MGEELIMQSRLEKLLTDLICKDMKTERVMLLYFVSKMTGKKISSECFACHREISCSAYDCVNAHCDTIYRTIRKYPLPFYMNAILALFIYADFLIWLYINGKIIACLVSTVILLVIVHKLYSKCKG